MTMLRYRTPISRPVAARNPQPDWLPRADAQETATEYVVRVDAPGLSESDFDIQLQEGVLTVSGERKAPERAGRRPDYVVRESHGVSPLFLAAWLPARGCPALRCRWLGPVRTGSVGAG